MRALLIEADVHTGTSLFSALQNAGYSVDWVRDDAVRGGALIAPYYAVVLMDLRGAGQRAIDVLRRVRAAGNSVPVVVLTARDDVQLRVRSFEAGADDCMPEPFAVSEVLARIGAVLRRRAGHATSRIGAGSLCLDLDRRTLTVDGVVSALSAREFALMQALLASPGTVLSRSQLEDRLYGWGKEIESNAVDVLIHSMRKKFGRSIIRNVRGLGWTVQQRSMAIE
jgi:two-component system OmpR family response regulator